MNDTRRRTTSRSRLLHELNARYRAEWSRAEALQRRLSRFAPLERLLRMVHRLFVREKPCPEASLTFAPPRTFVAPEPPASATVSVVVPFRDRPELLRACLRGLRATTGAEVEIVLVDNGSRDEGLMRSLRRMERRCRAVVVRRDEAFNFSRLCNAGAKVATGEYLLFLNNDVEPINDDWLANMLAAVHAPGAGVVGATLLYPDDTIQHAGMYPAADGRHLHAYRGLPASHAGAHGECGSLREAGAVTGACLLVRRDLFDAVGGFDEALPVTGNDVELCRRVRERGLSVLVSPDARLYHYESLSRGYSM